MPQREVIKLPKWFAASVRRAAFRSSLGWVLPIGAALILLAGIGALLWLGEAESPWIPVFWLTLFGAALLVFCWEFFVQLRRLVFPSCSPEIRYLGRFGSVAEVLWEVSMELDDPLNVRAGREITMTRHWLVISGGKTFAVRRLDDLVWAFPKVENVYLAENIYIVIRRIPYAVFRFEKGEECRARASAEETAALLGTLSVRCPKVLLAWTEELEKLWAEDRVGFAAGIQAQRGITSL